MFNQTNRDSIIGHLIPKQSLTNTRLFLIFPSHAVITWKSRHLLFKFPIIWWPRSSSQHVRSYILCPANQCLTACWISFPDVRSRRNLPVKELLNIKNQGKGMLEVPWLAVELREWFASSRSTFHWSFLSSKQVLICPDQQPKTAKELFPTRAFLHPMSCPAVTYTSLLINS